MKSSQTKGINSHIFRFQREYGVILRISIVDLPLCHHLAKGYSPLKNRRNSEGRTKDERRKNIGTAITLCGYMFCHRKTYSLA